MTGTIDDWLGSICKSGSYRDVAIEAIPKALASGTCEDKAGDTTLSLGIIDDLTVYQMGEGDIYAVGPLDAEGQLSLMIIEPTSNGHKGLLNSLVAYGFDVKQRSLPAPPAVQPVNPYGPFCKQSENGGPWTVC